jgi:hypothetical protein
MREEGAEKAIRVHLNTGFSLTLRGAKESYSRSERKMGRKER